MNKYYGISAEFQPHDDSIILELKGTDFIRVKLNSDQVFNLIENLNKQIDFEQNLLSKNSISVRFKDGGAELTLDNDGFRGNSYLSLDNINQLVSSLDQLMTR